MINNTYLLLAAGVVPALLLFAILTAVQRKKHFVRNIAALAAFAVMGSALAAAGMMQMSAAAVPEESLQRMDALPLIYAIADSGDVQRSVSMLTEERQHMPYSDRHTLCAARLYTLQGDYTAAAALYTKLQMTAPDSAPQNELSAVLAAARSSNAALISGDRDAIKERERLVRAAEDAVEDAIEQAVKGDDAAEDTAELISEAHALYAEYEQTGFFDRKKAENCLEDMADLAQEREELFTLSEVRSARLRLQILCEEYSEAAASLDHWADHNELLILSELYVNDYVDSNDFSDAYTENRTDLYRELAQRLQDYNDIHLKDAPSEQRKTARECITFLEERASDSALAALQQDMLTYAQDPYASDSSKVYLQLARLENTQGEDEAARRYLDRSLDTVGNCDDSDYTQPMYQIIGIIADKDDPERLKDVAGYVDQVLENTLPVEVSTSTAVDPEGGEAEDFSSYMTDYVSQKRASINIVSIDASQFETVTARVNIEADRIYTAEEFETLLRVTDCGVDIENFTVEKVEYTGANILLCCDVSGSMDGAPERHLAEAVELFITNKPDIEDISIVAFESSVRMTVPFGSSDEALRNALGQLYASGGTNMYDALLTSIDSFRSGLGDLNCIILLSDGEDNAKRYESDIYEFIGEPCRARGIPIYSIGLGSRVDAKYLNAFAESSGGTYLHANDSQTLSEFYSYIQGQILNQYTITFRAEDTLSVARTLEISMHDDPLAYDSMTYSLQADSDTVSGEVGATGPVFMQGKSITGLDSRLVFKSSRSIDMRLLGSGFEADDVFSVSLKGNINYDNLKTDYVSEGEAAFTIPAGVACGVYDVHVTINGKKAILDNGLTVAVQGSEKITAFGPYVFTSYSKIEEGNVLTLDNCVTLNGWLHFKDYVTLTGDLSGTEIVLYDSKGSQIRYQQDNSSGLASLLASWGKPLPLPALGRVTLCRDATLSPDSDDYPVRPIVVPAFFVSNVATFSTPGLALYPNKIQLNINEFTTNFPFQNQILKVSGYKSIFTFKHEESIILSPDAIDLTLEFSSEGKKDDFTSVNFGSLPMFLLPTEFELKIDTLKDEYSVKYISSLTFLDAEGLGLELQWSERLVPKQIRLYADFDIKGQISGVPVVYSDFSLGLDDIDPAKSLLQWTLIGSFDLSTPKIGEKFPGLEKWLDDKEIILLDDTTVKLSLGQFFLDIEATLKLFEKLTLAEASLKAGTFEYSNRLLNMDEDRVAGIVCSVSAGLVEWDTDNCDIDLQGGLEASITNRMIGLTAHGDCHLHLNWWILTHDFDAAGMALIGIHYDHSGDLVFTARAVDSGSDEMLYIAWSTRSGADYGKTTL